ADLVGVWDRVKSFVRRFLSSIGITDWQARDVHMALDSIGAWRQAKTPPLPAEARYQAVYGRPDLANPATNPDARAFVDDTDEKLKTESPRGYQDAADVAR